MTPRAATIDLDDVEGLLAADREGLLRAAAMAGAQVRATAAAVDEGALDLLRSEIPPRTLIWIAEAGAARAAGAVLAAALGAASGVPIVVAPEVPPWTGALDVVVVAGADAGDPVLVAAAATGVRRGARVAVVAPHEGPLRDATAGRAAVLAPRLPVPDEFGLTRYLAAGVAGLGVLWLPDYMARPHVARGELLPLFEQWTVDAMPLFLAYPPNRHVSKKLRVFIDWVVELMARDGGAVAPS